MDDKHHRRICRLWVTLTVICFAAFALRLADWQLVHGKEYRAIAARATQVTVTTEAARGEILDRSGKGLSVNQPQRRLVLDKLTLSPEDLDETLLHLASLLQKTDAEWEPPAPEGDPGELRERYGISGSYRTDELRILTGLRQDMERQGFSYSTPYVMADKLTQGAVGVISENIQGVSGISVESRLVRKAENPTLAPHILGATGAITAEEYADLSDEGYGMNDQIGRFGIEAAFESELRGEDGRRVVSRGEDGSQIDTVETVEARDGHTVWLTLDSELQEKAQESLQKNIRAAGGTGSGECQSGAAVMLDVRDFSVLAAVSAPTYDLNRYSDYGSYYVSLAESDTAPLFHRAFAGTYAWGSAFKPCTALAALENGVITPQTRFTCTRFYDYYPSNVVACMHYHGEENLLTAMAHSCNWYFAETGRRLGIAAMDDCAERLGLGAPTGVEIEEGDGILAGRDSAQWQEGNTVQAAIGQSDNAFTPLQMAAYTASIASNGVRMKTRLAEKITDYSRETVITDFRGSGVATDCGISREHLDEVKKAMLAVTQSPEGTAFSVFGSYPVQVAGKTGTAENAGADHAAFICFAPYESPEVAVAVILEHGENTLYAQQVARDMLDGYFE